MKKKHAWLLLAVFLMSGVSRIVSALSDSEMLLIGVAAVTTGTVYAFAAKQSRWIKAPVAAVSAAAVTIATHVAVDLADEVLSGKDRKGISDRACAECFVMGSLPVLLIAHVIQ